MAGREPEDLVAGVSPNLGTVGGGDAYKTGGGGYQTAWRVVSAYAGCRIGSEYPVLLVNHAQTRREYLELGKHTVTT